MEKEMRVLYVEGVAIHGGPEPCDDYVAGFQHRDDAERFLRDLCERLARFALELKAEKTPRIEVGRFAAERRAGRGERKPETFEFLGFTHICAKDRHERFKLKRITSKKRMRAKVREVKTELMRRRHLPIPDQGRWLASVLRRHYNYYAVPDNNEALRGFHLSSGDFVPALAQFLGSGAGLSPAVITRLTETWKPEQRAYVYLWADGIHMNIRLEEHKLCLLVRIGLRVDGRKELVALADGYRGSAESWADLLRDCARRGMRAPVLAVGDGALGFWNALRKVFPETREGRCWFHKAANVLAALPKTGGKLAERPEEPQSAHAATAEAA
jgi:hypothetical protein